MKNTREVDSNITKQYLSGTSMNEVIYSQISDKDKVKYLTEFFRSDKVKKRRDKELGETE